MEAHIVLLLIVYFVVFPCFEVSGLVDYEFEIRELMQDTLYDELVLSMTGLAVVRLEDLLTTALKRDELVEPLASVLMSESWLSQIYGDVQVPGSLEYFIWNSKCKALVGGSAERASKTRIFSVLLGKDCQRSRKPLRLESLTMLGDAITYGQFFLNELSKLILD